MKLNSLQVEGLYSREELNDLGLLSQGIRSGNGLVRNSEGKYLGASVVYKLKCLNGMKVSKNEYVDVLSLAMALESDDVFSIAKVNGNSKKLSINGSNIQVVPYELLHYYGKIYDTNSLHYISKTQTFTTIDELIDSFPEVNISFENLKYINQNSKKKDKKIAKELGIDESVITLTKLKAGFLDLTSSEIVSLSSKLYELKNKTEKTQNENLEDKIFINSYELSSLETSNEEVSPINHLEVADFGFPKGLGDINDNMYYKISQIIGICGFDYEKILREISNGNFTPLIVRHDLEEVGIKDEEKDSYTDLKETFPTGTSLIKGSEVNEYLKGKSLKKSGRLSRREEILNLANGINNLLGNKIELTKAEIVSRHNEVGLENNLYRDISGLDLLTKEQEINLGERIQNGDIIAVHDMVEANIRLVGNVARKYISKAKHLKMSDLMHHGILGLQKAAYKFEPELGFRFSTYATNWVKQAIQRGIGDEDSTVRKPMHIQEKERLISKHYINFVQKNGREPTIQETHEDTGIPKTKIRKIKSLIRESSLSLDQSLTGKNGEGSEFISLIGDTRLGNYEGNLIDEDLIRKIEELLCQSGLNEKEKDIIKRRFGLYSGNGYDNSQILEDIAGIYWVTRERIRKIEAKGLKKLERSANWNKSLKEFLENSEKVDNIDFK